MSDVLNGVSAVPDAVSDVPDAVFVIQHGPGRVRGPEPVRLTTTARLANHRRVRSA
ncbi:hypothetical protein [Haloechinothrix halophila]|uniref:hypothetical protein n=1 Tax=Haloechinothrix halophila TaxID=1069073 RepID=UPI0003FD3C9D|nr:hypothetical protein [Haloechinothrix halophila]